MPQDLDAAEGEEEQTFFTGAPLDIGPDDVFAWSFPTNAGHGDPLLREPEAVLSDVRDGRISATPQAPAGVRSIADVLGLFEGRFVCGRCSADAGPADGNTRTT